MPIRYRPLGTHNCSRSPPLGDHTWCMQAAEGNTQYGGDSEYPDQSEGTCNIPQAIPIHSPTPYECVGALPVVGVPVNQPAVRCHPPGDQLTVCIALRCRIRRNSPDRRARRAPTTRQRGETSPPEAPLGRCSLDSSGIGLWLYR